MPFYVPLRVIDIWVLKVDCRIQLRGESGQFSENLLECMSPRGIPPEARVMEKNGVTKFSPSCPEIGQKNDGILKPLATQQAAKNSFECRRYIFFWVNCIVYFSHHGTKNPWSKNSGVLNIKRELLWCL
jgi:hypothetical protein